MLAMEAIGIVFGGGAGLLAAALVPSKRTLDLGQGLSSTREGS